MLVKLTVDFIYNKGGLHNRITARIRLQQAAGALNDNLAKSHTNLTSYN